MDITEQIQRDVTQLPPDKQIEVLDFVRFLLQQQARTAISLPNLERSKRIKQSLENLAKLKTFSDIADPVKWQQSIRQDRPLPGRES